MATAPDQPQAETKQPIFNRLLNRNKKSGLEKTGRKTYWQYIKATPIAKLRQQMAAPLMLFVISITAASYLWYYQNRPVVIPPPLADNIVPTQVIAQPRNENSLVALNRSEPVRVRIAKVSINSATMPVGKKADGTMQVPGRGDITGWYTLAPTPGELGPAIIVGHLDQPGGPAVFWRLRELVPGDVIEIDRADGKTVRFNVDKVEQFEQKNFPTQSVYGNIDHAGIRLITCGGTFDREVRQYTHNTVVFGSMITD